MMWVAECGWCGETKEVYAYMEGEDDKGNVLPIPQCEECYYEGRGEDVPEKLEEIAK